MRISSSRAGTFGVALLVACFVTNAVLADGTDSLRGSASDQTVYTIPDTLPAVARAPQKVTPGVGEAVSVLSFDDGTCEGGLGVGAMISSMVDFDVPTQCTTGGLDIIAMTARMNSGSAQGIVLHQAGAAPGGPGGGVSVAGAFAGEGPCTAGGVAGPTMQVAVAPGSLVVTGTANFFAGLVNTGFAGRDTGSSAGRIWINCATCGMSQYTPADIAGLGLGGNWMIRVSVEDANCPVELLGFDIE